MKRATTFLIRKRFEFFRKRALMGIFQKSLKIGSGYPQEVGVLQSPDYKLGKAAGKKKKKRKN
ncbi:MAG: hypothetical protein AAB583_03070 [Patescibacteria group bacterium]